MTAYSPLCVDLTPIENAEADVSADVNEMSLDYTPYPPPEAADPGPVPPYVGPTLAQAEEVRTSNSDMDTDMDMDIETDADASVPETTRSDGPPPSSVHAVEVAPQHPEEITADAAVNESLAQPAEAEPQPSPPVRIKLKLSAFAGFGGDEAASSLRDTSPANGRRESETVSQAVELQPQAVEPQPQAVEPQPQAVEPQPPAVEPQPQVVEEQPQAVEPQPQVVEEQPQAVEPQPQAVEPQPEVVEPQSHTAESESTAEKAGDGVEEAEMTYNSVDATTATRSSPVEPTKASSTTPHGPPRNQLSSPPNSSPNVPVADSDHCANKARSMQSSRSPPEGRAAGTESHGSVAAEGHHHRHSPAHNPEMIAGAGWARAAPVVASAGPADTRAPRASGWGRWPSPENRGYQDRPTYERYDERRHGDARSPALWPSSETPGWSSSEAPGAPSASSDASYQHRPSFSERGDRPAPPDEGSQPEPARTSRPASLFHEMDVPGPTEDAAPPPTKSEDKWYLHRGRHNVPGRAPYPGASKSTAVYAARGERLERRKNAPRPGTHRAITDDSVVPRGAPVYEYSHDDPRFNHPPTVDRRSAPRNQAPREPMAARLEPERPHGERPHGEERGRSAAYDRYADEPRRNVRRDDGSPRDSDRQGRRKQDGRRRSNETVEPQFRPANYKTQQCRFFRQGHCPRDQDCWYLHGAE